MFEATTPALEPLTRRISSLRRALQDTSETLYAHGWAFGTSGNYSVAVDREPLRLLITASGRDKRRLTDGDFVLVDDAGAAVDAGAPRPSAETLLHTMLARRGDVGAVLHTHSIWNTVLSDLFARDYVLRIDGYEMLKGLAGVDTHAAAVDIPIFENTQDIPALAQQVRQHLDAKGDGPPHAFLIRGHGLYTWGRDLAEARRHVEILEFLFEVCGRRMELQAARGRQA